MIKRGSIIQREVSVTEWAVHTGIYIGRNKVIHFDGESSNSDKSLDKVVMTSLEEFSDGKDVFIRKEPIDEIHGEKVIKRAFQIMNDKNNDYNGNYGIIFGKNCQDFTADCFNI